MATTTDISVKGDYGRRYAIINSYADRIKEKSRKSYLTFEAKEDNTTVYWITTNASSWVRTLSASTDGGTTWDSKVSSAAPGTALGTINRGQKLLVKGGYQNAFMGSNALYCYFSSDKDVYVYGNIMSLTQGDDFANATTLIKRYQFGRLFYSMSTLLTDPKRGHIILPATEGFATYPYTYDSTFSGCTKMTVPPELPMTTLGTQTMMSMFRDTPSLRGKVIIRAATIPDYACYTMFYNSGIDEVVILASTLGAQACRMMFRSATRISKVTCLATDISASLCTNGWFDSAPATGVFTKAASMTSWPRTTSGIPTGWTVQDYNA